MQAARTLQQQQQFSGRTRCGSPQQKGILDKSLAVAAKIDVRSAIKELC